MRSLLSVLLIVLAGALAGCSFSVTQLAPRPNVALPTQTPKFELDLQPSVEDNFDVPAQNGVMGGSVVGWHASLKKGFENGFPDGAVDATAKLRLESAEFSLVPSTVAANGQVIGARAQLRFRGRWYVGNSEIPVAGVAESKNTTTSPGDVNNLAQSSIETMYEMMADALVKTMATAPQKGQELTPDGQTEGG